jgi:hypothetical protein
MCLPSGSEAFEAKYGSSDGELRRHDRPGSFVGSDTLRRQTVTAGKFLPCNLGWWNFWPTGDPQAERVQFYPASPISRGQVREPATPRCDIKISPSRNLCPSLPAATLGTANAT